MTDETEIVDVPASQPDSGSRSSSTTVTSDDSVELWKQKYTGVQGHANRLKRQLDELNAKNASLAEQLAERETTLTAQVEQLTTQLRDFQSQFEQASAKANKLERQQELGRHIRTQHPELAGLYDEGLLLGVESLEGEELDGYLTRYAEKLGAVKDTILNTTVSGSTPPPPSAPEKPAMTLTEANAAVNKAIREHGVNSPQTQEAMDVYRQIIINGENNDA